MSNLKTIINNAPSIFGKLTEAKMKEQLKTLKQIEMVSMQAKIPINDIDILKLFRDKPGKNLLVTDPKEINKRLFEFHNVNKAMVARANIEELLTFEKRIVTNMKKSLPVTTILSTLKSNLDNASHYIRKEEENLKYLKDQKREYIINNSKEDYEQHVARYQANIDFWKAKAENYPASEARIKAYADGSGVIQDLAKITMKGFWKFVQIKGIKLYFMTVNDVILFEKNTRQGLNLQKNMGQYCVELDLARFTVKVMPWKNNIVNGHNIHPYVNQGGGVCMGNAGTYFEQARQEYDIAKSMDILGTILSAYSTAGGPYKPLVEFINESYPKEMSAMAKQYYAKRGESTILKRVTDLMALGEDIKETSNGLSKTLGPRERRPRRNNTPATATNEAEALADIEPEFDDEEFDDSDEMDDFDEDDMIDDSEEEDDEEGYF